MFLAASYMIFLVVQHVAFEQPIHLQKMESQSFEKGLQIMPMLSSYWAARALSERVNEVDEGCWSGAAAAVAVAASTATEVDTAAAGSLLHCTLPR